jgi:membrane fusion protein (multidrug efflux system)
MSDVTSVGWPSRVREVAIRYLPPAATRYVTPRMILMLLIVGGIFAVVFVAIALRGSLSGGGAGGIPPQTVSTTHAQYSFWQPQLRAVGSLHAVQGSDMAAEVSGLVTRVAFNPGDDVKKGTLLVQLRDDSDRAALAGARAAAQLAAVVYQRNQRLIRENAISKTEADTALSNMLATKAQVEAAEAAVEKKAIRAPFNGRVGIRQVDVGQYVSAGQVLVTLQQLNPIYVDFQIPQQQLSAVQVGSTIALTSDAVANQTFTGKVIALDPKVDPATRNLRVRAAVDNAAQTLLPGMFGTVLVTTGKPQRYITLPQTAVVYSPYGDTVFIVTDGKDATGKPEQTVLQRFVTVGDTRGDQVAILKGVNPNDDIVSIGQIKLKNGTPVLINNTIKMPDSASPEPVDR